MIKGDTEKLNKRKLGVKASRKTYVSKTVCLTIHYFLHKFKLAREDAVKKAVKDGTVNPKNLDEVRKLRKSVERVFALN